MSSTSRSEIPVSSSIGVGYIVPGFKETGPELYCLDVIVSWYKFPNIEIYNLKVKKTEIDKDEKVLSLIPRETFNVII